MAKPILNEKTIADYMKRNKCDREEAIDLIKYDIAVESDRPSSARQTDYRQYQDVRSIEKHRGTC